MDKVFSILCLWSLFGYFFILFFPKPKTKRAAFFQAFINGPIVWVGVLVFGIKYKTMR